MFARRSWPLALVFLLVACGARDHSEGIARAESPPAHALGALKVATWNLEWLHRANNDGPVKRSDADYARLRSYAERLAADVIAFQEVEDERAAERVFDPARYRVYVAKRGDTQRTGFAVRRDLQIEVHADYDALDVGQLRSGADITVRSGTLALRLLSVHLKSGCFDAPLDGAQRECQKLATQLPMLEAWIDARGREGVAAVVLGDFNRRLFARKGEPFWAAIDDADPPASDLWSPTDGQVSTCWSGEHPAFIDHIVLNVPAKRSSIADSFELFQYDARDANKRALLSDHCPIAITFDEHASPVVARKLPAPLPPVVVATTGPIKGNISGGGKKLYHLPVCPDYARVQIDAGKGERVFSSEDKAREAGFTKAGNCP